MNRNDLERLTKEELIDLVLRMQRPDKTSRNSSKPPATDRKEQRENSKPGGAKPGHEGHSRRLADKPDAFEDHAPTRCERCGLPFRGDAERELIGEYDEIELAPVRPFVRRHRRFSIRCACCGKPTPAPLPPAAQGTPFGPNIHALAVYLKTMQLFSYERLSGAFHDLFGLQVSQGALMNRRRPHEGGVHDGPGKRARRAAPRALRGLRRDGGAHRGRQRLPLGLLLRGRGRA